MNYDLILHLDMKNSDLLRLVTRNAQNYLNALPGEKFDLQVVANGGGATLFTAEHEELREMIIPLQEKGVTFKVCANALAEHGISHDQVWPGCVIVPAGLVEIVNLQRQGYAYIKP